MTFLLASTIINMNTNNNTIRAPDYSLISDTISASKLTLFSLIDILWSIEAEESSGDEMPEVPSGKL